MTTDYDTAKKIFVDQDQAAGMQAFMAGKIKVQGDMMKMMAMQTGMPQDDDRQDHRQRDPRDHRVVHGSRTPGLDTITGRERRALRALLIGATAAASHPDRRDGLAELVAAAPIDALPEAAALHRVAGTVLRGLDGVAGVDDERARRAGGVAGTRRRCTTSCVVGALNQIGRAFDEAGLSWVVMKGPVVAALLYPDVGDRTYGDLDLLVDRRDFAQAMQILEDFGYEHSIHNWALAEEMLAGQVGMTSPAVSIDLHWHLHYSHEDRRPFALDPEAMIERNRRVVVSGVSVPTLDTVDTLLTLAFHAARSDGHRLVWFKDVERSVAVDAPDFDELVRRCRACALRATGRAHPGPLTRSCSVRTSPTRSSGR